MCARTKPTPPVAPALTTFECVTPDLTWCPVRRQFGVFAKGGCDLYSVGVIACDPGMGGRGYQVEKCEGGEVESSYACFLDSRGPGWDSCECWGFLRYGRCRHLNALRTLDADGRLDEPNPLAEAPALPDVEDAEIAAWVEEVAGRYAESVGADRITREPVEDAGEWIGDSERVVEWAEYAA